MTTTTYDAYGRPVDSLTQCSKCGQMVKEVYYFEGKPYGNKCILRVTGQPVEYFVLRGREIDLEATDKRNLDRAEYVKARVEAEAVRREAYKEQAWSNYYAFPGLEWVLRDAASSSDFCYSIYRELYQADFINNEGELCYAHYQIKPLAELPGKALRILSDIYGKSQGRRNSKAYQEAVDNFYDAVEKAAGEEE